MKIIVFGATGGVGRELIRQCLARGHRVTAFARRPEAIGRPDGRVHLVHGDALDGDAVAGAIAGQQAVLCALGPGSLLFQDETAACTRNILYGMEEQGVRRLVACSALGVGDSREYIPPMLKRALLRPLAEKELQEQVVRESRTDWVIVRPASLSDEPARGEVAAVLSGPPPSSTIARADVAAFMVDQLTPGPYLHKSPAISWPDKGRGRGRPGSVP